jgi:hypothetical protein
VDAFGDVGGIESEGRITIGVFWPRHGSPLVLPDFCPSGLVLGGTTFSEPFAITADSGNAKRTVTVVGRCYLSSPSNHTSGFGPALWKIRVNGSSRALQE